MFWCSVFLKNCGWWNGAARLWNTSPCDFSSLNFPQCLETFSYFTLPTSIGKHLLVWLALTSNYRIYCISSFLKGCALGAFICHYYVFLPIKWLCLSAFHLFGLKANSKDDIIALPIPAILLYMKMLSSLSSDLIMKDLNVLLFTSCRCCVQYFLQLFLAATLWKKFITKISFCAAEFLVKA